MMEIIAKFEKTFSGFGKERVPEGTPVVRRVAASENREEKKRKPKGKTGRKIIISLIIVAVIGALMAKGILKFDISKMLIAVVIAVSILFAGWKIMETWQQKSVKRKIKPNLTVFEKTPSNDNVEENNSLERKSLFKILKWLFFLGLILSIVFKFFLIYLLSVFLLFIIGYLTSELVYTLGEKNLFFFSIRPGECKFLIAGSDEKKGEIVGLKINWKDRYVASNKYIKSGKTERDFITLLFPGIYAKFWPGQKVLKYTFDWSEYEEDGNGKMQIKRYSEETNRIILKNYQYAAVYTAVETDSAVPVGYTLLINLNIESPEIAIIDNVQWLTIVITDILSAIREFTMEMADPEAVMRATKNGYLDRNGEKLDSLGAIFLDYIKRKKIENKMGEPAPIWDKIFFEQGVRITGISVRALDLGTWAETAEKILKAMREGDAAIIEAQKKGTAFADLLELQQGAWEKFFKALGEDNARMLQYLDTLKEMSKQPSAKFVQLPSSLTNLAEILGEKIK